MSSLMKSTGYHELLQCQIQHILYTSPPLTTSTRILQASLAWTKLECLKEPKRLLLRGHASVISATPSCCQPSGSRSSTGGEGADIVKSSGSQFVHRFHFLSLSLLVFTCNTGCKACSKCRRRPYPKALCPSAASSRSARRLPRSLPRQPRQPASGLAKKSRSPCHLRQPPQSHSPCPHRPAQAQPRRRLPQAQPPRWLRSPRRCKARARQQGARSGQLLRRRLEEQHHLLPTHLLPTLTPLRQRTLLSTRTGTGPSRSLLDPCSWTP